MSFIGNLAKATAFSSGAIHAALAAKEGELGEALKIAATTVTVGVAINTIDHSIDYINEKKR